MSYLSAARNTCELFDIGDDGSERVAVVGVAVQRLGMQHELPASGRGDRRGNRDLAAEFVRRPRLATADALDLQTSTASEELGEATSWQQHRLKDQIYMAMRREKPPM